MKKLIINTSKTEKGYSASCDIIAGWVVAYTGDFSGFVEYVKESIDFYVECATEDEEVIPDVLLGDYEILYSFDIKSLLWHYNKFFSYASLEHITGINQRQLWHYAVGKSKPRPKQREKIITSLNRLGAELTALSI